MKGVVLVTYDHLFYNFYTTTYNYFVQRDEGKKHFVSNGSRRIRTSQRRLMRMIKNFKETVISCFGVMNKYFSVQKNLIYVRDS